MRRALLGLLLIAGTAAYIATLVVNATGEWFASNPTADNLARGLSWNSGNPLLWTAYARQRLYSSEPAKSVDAFTRAARLNPVDPANWEGLASAYLQALDSARTETALRAWLVALPSSPEAAWRLGNFLILQDRSPEAFPYLKKAAGADRRLHMPLFDLAWKISADGEEILRDLVPAEHETRVDYLYFLVQRKNFPECRRLWAEVRGGGSSRLPSLGYYYVDTLVNAGRGEEAARVWGDLLAMTGRASAKPAGEMLTNGDFEAGLPNAGLDWRIQPGPGYEVNLDDSVAQSGARSLLISFDGSANPDFYAVTQRVPVRPATNYVFRAMLRTENISTDNGFRFSVRSLTDSPSERFELLTENRNGTNSWTQEKIYFRTGPSTELVVVTLRRIRSQKLNSLIQGKVWVDGVSIRNR